MCTTYITIVYSGSMQTQETPAQLALRKKLLSLRPGATAAELRGRIAELCAMHGYDPVQSLLTIVKSAESDARQEILDIAEKVKDIGLKNRLQEAAKKIIPADIDQMISIHKEILQYVAPKLRATEVKGDIDVNIHVTVQKFGESKTIDAIIKDVPKESDEHRTTT